MSRVPAVLILDTRCYSGQCNTLMSIARGLPRRQEPLYATQYCVSNLGTVDAYRFMSRVLVYAKSPTIWRPRYCYVQALSKLLFVCGCHSDVPSPGTNMTQTVTILAYIGVADFRCALSWIGKTCETLSVAQQVT